MNAMCSPMSCRTARPPYSPGHGHIPPGVATGVMIRLVELTLAIARRFAHEVSQRARGSDLARIDGRTPLSGLGRDRVTVAITLVLGPGAWPALPAGGSRPFGG